MTTTKPTPSSSLDAVLWGVSMCGLVNLLFRDDTPHLLTAEQLAEALDARPPHPLAYLTVAMHFNPDLAGIEGAAARLRYNGACDLDAWRLERPTTPEGLTAHRVPWEEFRG